MKHNRLVLTRPLPKTGQITSYRAGDDGIFEAGWWEGRLNANNKTRFIAKTIGGDDVVIDLATGLMWAADGTAAGGNNGGNLNWNEAIDYANALDFAGFTDWRLPNIFEIDSILDWSQDNPAIDATVFPNTVSNFYWSSSTRAGDTTKAWYCYVRYGGSGSAAKTTDYYIRCVRGGV